MLTPVQMSAPARRYVRFTLPIQRPAPQKVAVLLNHNARRVNEKIARRLERLVGPDHFFYSRTLEEAESFTREIVQRGYGTVVCGGGDGTLVRTINLVRRYIDESNAWRTERHDRFGEAQTLLGMPRFALLPLGTGNGLKGIVGARDAVDDLRHMVDFVPSRSVELPMIVDEATDDRFLFGGMGYDSILLNDYNWLKERTKTSLMRPALHSVLGYFAALFSRTLPRIARGQHRPIQARITTHSEAFYIDPRRGDRLQRIAPNTTLFEGDATLIGIGTSSYFGYGFKVFPFAGLMPGMMQLRVARIGAGRAMMHLPTIWRGSYRNSDVISDFFVKHIKIELANPYPFQHSGDDQGLRDHLNLRIAHDPLQLVDLYQPRLSGW